MSGRAAEGTGLENRSTERYRGFESYLIRTMTNFKDTLKLLEQNFSIEVDYKLTRGQEVAVKRGFATQRCYQDQPANIIYIFRPRRYFLQRSQDFFHFIK